MIAQVTGNTETQVTVVNYSVCVWEFMSGFGFSASRS